MVSHAQAKGQRSNIIDIFQRAYTAESIFKMVYITLHNKFWVKIWDYKILTDY